MKFPTKSNTSNTALFKNTHKLLVFFFLVVSAFCQPLIAQQESKTIALIQQLQDNITSVQDSTQFYNNAHKALRQTQLLNNDTLQAGAHVILARWHRNNITLDSTLYYLNTAKTHLEKGTTPQKLAELYLLYETIYKDRSDFGTAEPYTYKALSIYEKTDDKKGIANCYLRLSDLYYYQDRYDKGKEYADKVLAMPYAQEDVLIYANAHRYKANNQLFNEQPKDALPNAQKAVELLSERYENTREMTASRNTLANIQKYLGKYDKALQNYQSNRDWAEKSGDISMQIAATGNTGHVYLLQEKYKEAIPFFLEAIDLIQKSGTTKNLWENYMHASIAYEELGNYKKALEYDILYGRERMKYLNSIITRLESEMQVKYETNKKEETIAQQEATIVQQRKTQLLYIVLAVLFALSLLGAFLSLRNIRKKSKALAQANEKLAIERSMEKVRNVALSLTTSDDMLRVAKELYEQLLELGFHNIRNAIIDINNESDGTFIDYDYSHDTGGIVTTISYDDDPILEEQLGVIAKSTDQFSESIYRGKELQDIIDMRREKGEADDPRLENCEVLSYNLYAFGNGAIGISNFGILNEQEKNILDRFRNVFTFAYQRHIDLQIKEAQTREAQIEAALEKVRSAALGLNKSEDMLKVTQALYEQLLELGFSNIRNAIIDINNEESETFLDYDYSHEMGGTVTLMSYDDDPVLEEQVREIAQSTDKFSETLLKGQQLQDLINMRRANGEEDDPRLLDCDAVSYNLYAFGNGAIGISNFGVLGEVEKEILSRFRNVFTFAYQRFVDLQTKEKQEKALREEKKRLEIALSELQATQQQLIHAEKMASLGELTAGIAHEIQNPLNFVNNFSDLSQELIDEIDQEILNGDMDEVKAILTDVKHNLEKIHHHGKRADGIVKGMLQHSRSNTGQKELTDINKLADEYLRLAYHGLRAKDKTFNADIDSILDESLEPIPLVAQDIGRVILNLITNAFQACSEYQKSLPPDEKEVYKPKVSVTTQKGTNGAILKIQDNGPGIPEEIADKIFQPFFTTKPTGQGTGLGLSLSYDIVKAHNGNLELKTEKGKGTQFIITLPHQKQTQ